ncbi:S49 family peptidase, partial [Salmonella enterica subsp. enterica]
VTVMAAALKSNPGERNMPELTAKEAAAQENQRVMGIIGCPEAKGREQLAQMLASQPGMSVTQAQAILAAAAPQQEVVSEADRIMALEEADGRGTLAAALAAMPDMTAERAKTILAASPRSNATSLSDSILTLDEAKGCEELAGKLATTPGMTVEQARELLAA